jgi:2-polyprenyl-3-methyl-5-hydroxy-6-metoxy-1,4-benzoquinol methylase
MFTHPAEKLYFQEYFSEIVKHLPPASGDVKILDIGSQNGRFTIPLAKKGYSILATDLHDKYFEFIKKHIPHDAIVKFRKEDVHETIKRQETFDVILCLEVLYILKDYKDVIKGLRKLLKPGGFLITSHRTWGYYVYRYIRERKFNALNTLLTRFPEADYNCQSPQELQQLFSTSGLIIESMKGIGMFSGFGKDAFSGIADASKLNAESKKRLSQLENSSELQQLFINNSRYVLVISRADE